MSDSGGALDEGQFVEFEKPGNKPAYVTGDIVEFDARPGTKQPFLVEEERTHTMRTQRWLGFVVVIATLGLHTLCIGALIAGWINNEQFTLIETAISAPQALAAAVIGFYYGRQKGSS